MKVRVAIAALITFLFAAMVFATAVDAGTPGYLQRLLARAQPASGRSTGGVVGAVEKIGEVPDLIVGGNVDLTCQFTAGGDVRVPDPLFTAGDTIHNVLTVVVVPPGAVTVSALYLWIGEAEGIKIFPERDWLDFWWPYNLAGPGVFRISMSFLRGCPDWKDKWMLIGAVKADFGAGDEYDIGVFNPTPSGFVIQ